jgi:hypothetical protein
VNEPWLEKKSWRENRILSGARYGHWALLAFALVWNGLTLPMFLNAEEFWGRIDKEPMILLALLFPLVGLGLLAAVAWALLGWRKFGPTPLVLDPFPGSIGGHVGGWVDTRIPFSAAQRFDVKLACMRSSVTGSGKNRKRSESVHWQTDGACHSERSGTGTQLFFRFTVPDGLPAAGLPRTGTYYLWRLSVACELEGPDFSRSYDIPVFATAQQSSLHRGTETHAATQDLAMEGLESIAEFRPVPGGIEALFPALQRPGRGIAALLFGGLFAGIGIGVGYAKDGGVVIPVVFFLVGTLILGYGIWYLAKSLLVGVTSEGLRCRRFLFGYPMKTRQLARADFSRFEIDRTASSSSGNKTTVYYQLHARGRDGVSLPVGERLTGRAEAELLKDTFETYLGAD